MTPEAEGPLPGRGSAARRMVRVALIVGYVGVLLGFPVGVLIARVAPYLAALGATFADPYLQSALALSFRVAIITTLVNGVLGTVIAWVMTRTNLPGRALLNGLIDLPFALSPVVIGFLLLLLVGRLGPFTPYLSAWHIKIAFAEPGIILATIFVTFPLMIREVIPVLEAADRDQENAAATLGAHGWMTFWLVVFPAIRRGLVAGLTQTFARALGEFGAVLVIGGGIEGTTETTPLYIFRALDDLRPIAAFTIALGLALFSTLLVLIVDRLLKSGTV